MNLPPTLKAALTPGSLFFLVLCLVAWALLRLLWPRRRRLARAWLWMVCGIYLVLGLPIVATTIVGRLPASPAPDASRLQAIDTLIIFDGDNRVGRVEAAKQVYAASHARAIVVLGQDWIRAALADAGVPNDRMSVDPRPATTRAQIVWVEQRLAITPAARIALVASRLQMPRVAGLVKAARLDLLLVAGPIDDEPPTSGAWRFVPSYVSLRASRDALYEHAALEYYAWKGWIRPVVR